MRYLAPPWHSGPVTSLTDAELAVAAATAGAAEVPEPVRRAGHPPRQGGHDFATSADLASEEAIRAVLAEHRPEDAMVGEEAGRTGPAGADPRVAGRPAVRHPQLRRHDAARRGQRRAARGRRGCSRRPAPTRSAARSSGPTAPRPAYDATVPTVPLTPEPVSLLVDVDLDHPGGGDALHLLAAPDVPARLQPAGRLDARWR